MPIYGSSSKSVGYHRPRKTMDDIYNWYRAGILNYGPYKAYFNTSRPLENSYSMKNKLERLPERQDISLRSEGKREEQRPEVKQIEPETKTETKSDTAQPESKAEHSQEPILEKPQQTSEIEKDERESPDMILTKYEIALELGQTDTNLNKRPSPFYDSPERW